MQSVRFGPVVARVVLGAVASAMLLTGCSEVAAPSPASEAELVVRVYSVGFLPDPEVTVLVDGQPAATLVEADLDFNAPGWQTPGGNWLSVAVPTGQHAIALAGLASNCVPVAGNPGSVDVSGRTVISLGVSCSGEGLLGKGTLAAIWWDATANDGWGNTELRLFNTTGEPVSTDGWKETWDVSLAPDGLRLAAIDERGDPVGTRSGIVRYLYPPCPIAGTDSKFDSIECGNSMAIAWGPQGNAVASVRLDPDKGCRIRISDAVENSPPVVYSCGSLIPGGNDCCWTAALDWSPAGDRLAVGTPRGLRILAIASGIATEVGSLAGQAVRAVAWSPAGDAIAVTTEAEGGVRYDLRVVTLSTGAVRTVTDWPGAQRGAPPGGAGPLVWSPGGKVLIAGLRDFYDPHWGSCPVNAVIPLDQPQAWRPLLPVCSWSLSRIDLVPR